MCAPGHFHIHTTSPPNGLRSLFVVLDFLSTLLRFTGLTSWLEILYLYVMSFSQCLFICYVLLYGCLLYDCMWILVWFVPVQNIVPTFNQEKFYNNLLTCMIMIKLKHRTRYFPTICFNNLKGVDSMYLGPLAYCLQVGPFGKTVFGINKRFRLIINWNQAHLWKAFKLCDLINPNTASSLAIIVLWALPLPLLILNVTALRAEHFISIFQC